MIVMHRGRSECEDGSGDSASARSNPDGAGGTEVGTPISATNGNGGGASGASSRNSVDCGSKRKRVSLACNACRLRKSKVRITNHQSSSLIGRMEKERGGETEARLHRGDASLLECNKVPGLLARAMAVRWCASEMLYVQRYVGCLIRLCSNGLSLGGYLHLISTRRRQPLPFLPHTCPLIELVGEVKELSRLTGRILKRLDLGFACVYQQSASSANTIVSKEYVHLSGAVKYSRNNRLIDVHA